MPAALPLTGERTAPGIWHENYWFGRHQAAYRWAAATLPPGGVVLEAGCGEGYGVVLLGDRLGARVVGVDYDAVTTAHAARTYDVPVLRGNLVTLPMRDASVDVVVAAQVLEHLWEQDRFVRECARVVRADGTVVVTTPNRLTFPPGNPFHFREVDPAQLRTSLDAHFADVVVLGVHHGPRLAAWEAGHGSLVEAQLATGHDAWPRALGDVVASVRADDFVIEHQRVDASLDLVALARHAKAPR
jgi:SAM-dependent methyltransferase